MVVPLAMAAWSWLGNFSEFDVLDSNEQFDLFAEKWKEH